jgi:hypothetical protein
MMQVPALTMVDRQVISAAGFANRAAGPAPLSVKRVMENALLIMALLLLNKGGTAGSLLCFAILGLMIFQSPSAAFKAVAICYVGLMINQSLVPKTIIWTPGRLVIPLLAFVRFSSDLARLHTSLFARKSYLALVVYVVVMAVCSILSGWFTSIALLKLFNFWAVVSSIFAGLVVLRTQRIDLSEWFVSLILAAALFGFLAIAFGVQNNYYGEVGGGRLFNGAFLHPNCHSMYASQFVVFLASIVMLGKYRNVWLALPLVAVWVVFMLMSEARTAVVATSAGVLALLVFARPTRNRRGWRLRVNFSRPTIWVCVFVAIAATIGVDAALNGAVRRNVVIFFNKGGSGEASELDTNQMMASRTGMIERSWNNFRESPIYGIGFQVAKTEAFVRNATWLTAPAEKGFLPTAVLEEGGILGAAAFVLFLLAYIGELWRERSTPALAMFATFLACNMTEVSIFSPGGSGSFGWIMVGASLILSDHCWRPPNAPMPRGRAFPESEASRAA